MRTGHCLLWEPGRPGNNSPAGPPVWNGCSKALGKLHWAVLGPVRLPLELVLHQPLLTGVGGGAGLQAGRARVAGLGRQALPCVDVPQAAVQLVVHPGLVAAHAVAADQLHRPVRRSRVQAVVVRHDLLPLGVGEHLVTPEPVAVTHADLQQSKVLQCTPNITAVPTSSPDFLPMVSRQLCVASFLISPRKK